LELSAARHRLLAPVRASVVAASSKDSPVTGNLAHLLLAQAPVKREAQKGLDSLVDLQLHRLQVRLPGARRGVDERGAKAPTVNPRPEHRLRQSRGRGNRSAERKKARELPRQDHNKFY
jgi:hypothetical protein